MRHVFNPGTLVAVGTALRGQSQQRVKTTRTPGTISEAKALADRTGRRGVNVQI